MSELILKNKENIYNRIKAAALKTGKSAENIKMVAVTKTFPQETVLEALECGITVFGENRVKEAFEKFQALQNKAELHLIGHLQRNKAKLAAKTFSWVQSIDKIDTAEELNRYAEIEKRMINILIQINTSGEETKSGLKDYKRLEGFIYKLKELKYLNIRGLMTIGPFTDNKQEIRNCFKNLKMLYDNIKKHNPALSIDTLSMGMSSDFEIAVEEGANMVRIGSALFGIREVF